jgi:ATP-dependent Clp protease ATP-binding subunit ClpC
VSEALRRARAGLKDPKRPIGSFIFLGPTGVGKTELARALAEYLFDDEDAIIRLDMSEYQERHTVSRIIGAPPGYVGYDEGGSLTEAVRRRPYRVILFDEIEKAHPDLSNLLLQIMEDGRLTDGHGRTVDFRNTILIMTSNLGTGPENKGRFGFVAGRAQDDGQRSLRQEQVERALREAFRPEFLNRIDEIIVFEPLTEAELAQIVDLMLAEVRGRLSDRHVDFEVTDAAKAELVKQGFDRVYGARPMRRTITRQIENPLAKRILAGEFGEGDLARVDVTDGAFTFEKAGHRDVAPAPEPVAAAG